MGAAYEPPHFKGGHPYRGLARLVSIPLGIEVAGGHVPDSRDLGDGHVPVT